MGGDFSDSSWLSMS